ncbi:MAG: glycosyltransferase family A protein [Waltera sp.]
MEKVSVIMPCYNDGKYIMEAIDSIVKQTYQNWELIIVDDGSDDEETKRIINEIQNPKIKVFHTEHLRPAGARNYGIQKAEGTYILPVDSDDRIHEEYMEKAVKMIESNPRIGVVYCKAELFGEKSGSWNLPDYSFKHMLLDNIVFVTALFYKSDWEKVGGFNTSMAQGMEDYDFWLSILGLEREICQIPEALFYYRIKPVSRTTNFQDNCVQVQNTYQQIYYNHKRILSETL